MRILLDTNVIIDLFEQREPFIEDTRKLLVMQTFGDAELWASAKSFTDIFYVMSKEFALHDIYAAFEESYTWLSLCSVDGADVKQATSAEWDDFEDCVIDICAQKVRADYLLTRNVADFRASKCKVMTPAAFFQHILTEYGVDYDECGGGT